MKSVGYILCADLKESAILISGGSSVTVIPHGIPSEEEVILYGWYFLSAFHLENQIAIFGPRECVYVFVSADTHCLLNFYYYLHNTWQYSYNRILWGVEHNDFPGGPMIKNPPSNARHEG